jgi:excisionase family DNA binding protein
MALAEDDYVSAEEAARILGVKVNTLYAYASRGRIRSYRQGLKRNRLYLRSELQDLVAIAPARRPGSELPRAEDWIPLTN